MPYHSLTIITYFTLKRKQHESISYLNYFYTSLFLFLLGYSNTFLMPSQEIIIYSPQRTGILLQTSKSGYGYQPVDPCVGHRICLSLPNG